MSSVAKLEMDRKNVKSHLCEKNKIHNCTIHSFLSALLSMIKSNVTGGLKLN